LMEDIATKLGYRSIRVFARQVRTATGMSPSTMRTAFTMEEFSLRMAALVCRPGDVFGNGESALNE